MLYERDVPFAASTPPTEVACPAGILPALKAALDHVVDSMCLGFSDVTNARNFSDQDFDGAAIAAGSAYAHACARQVLLALNTYPQAVKAVPLTRRF